LDNANQPPEPSLSEADQAEVGGFVDETLLCFPVLADARLADGAPPSSIPGGRATTSTFIRRPDSLSRRCRIYRPTRHVEPSRTDIFVPSSVSVPYPSKRKRISSIRSWACGRISQPASMYCVATLKAFDGQFLGERIVFMVPCEGAGCQYVSASSRGITTANGGAEVKAVIAGAYLTRSRLPTGGGAHGTSLPAAYA